MLPAPGAAAASARRTCSSVTTPRRRSSLSMTISAPSERRPSEPRSCSIGVSSWTRKASSPSAATTSATCSAGWPSCDGAVDPVLVQQPEEAPRGRVGDREPRPAVAQEELVLGLEHGGVARHPDGLGVHDVGHRHALQALGEAARDDRAGRRLAQEPAHEDPPDPAAGVAADEQEDAQPHEDVGEGLAEPRGEARPAVAVAGQLPRDRPGDAPAVEREGGDQVEDEEPDVDQRQPAEHGERGARVVAQEQARRTKSPVPPASTPPTQATITISSVTAGPAALTRNSSPGRLACRG